MAKTELTHAAIVDAALAMAQEGGLESLAIGTVAERVELSKSGALSRVGSREKLQVAALKEYERGFAAGFGLKPAASETYIEAFQRGEAMPLDAVDAELSASPPRRCRPGSCTTRRIV